ncbi:Hypothetical protein FKW44_008741, partial [Caligus rogercresseyi]
TSKGEPLNTESDSTVTKSPSSLDIGNSDDKECSEGCQDLGNEESQVNDSESNGRDSSDEFSCNNNMNEEELLINNNPQLRKSRKTPPGISKVNILSSRSRSSSITKKRLAPESH